MRMCEVKMLLKMYKKQINYRHFTFLNDFMFSCRQKSMSLLSSAFQCSMG